MNARPGITQPPVAPCASSKQQTKQKYKPYHQQTGLSPHSPSLIRGKTNKNSAQISADLSAETLHARRECQDIFKVLKRKDLQPRLQYLARISLKIDGDIKSFSDKQKLRAVSTTKPALQQLLKGLI